MLGLLFGFIITLMQWYKSRRQPDHQLTLKWIMFSMLVPGSLYVGSITVLHWLHIPGLIPQSYAYGFLAMMYVFISLGITRFALFNLGDWWQKIWLWLLIGLLFVATDIVFVSLLQWDSMLSTLTALSMTGLLYLPLRQWMITYIFKRKVISLEQIVPDILQLTIHAGDKHTLRQAWKSLLKKIFSPLTIRYVDHDDDNDDSEVSEMLRYNIAMIIPDIGAGNPLLLAYADQGGRLFSSKDRAFVASLTTLTRKTIEDAHAYQKGIGDERRRITSDIHDDLGAKLLSLVYKSENKEQRKLASPDCYCVVATIFSDKLHLFPALKAGADGYILKDEEREDIAHMLRGILDGDPPISASVARHMLQYFHDKHAGGNDCLTALSDRERDVLTCIARGMSNKECARMLSISHHTVSEYIHNVYRKLGVHSRAEATREAIHMGIV